MYDTIKNFASQFAYDPVVQNAEKLPRADGFIVAGMGGSHLAADLLHAWKPELPLIIHADYDLPLLPASGPKKTLLIASSYSGNTEETIDAFQKARERGYACAAITTGGKLLAFAQEANIPYILLPSKGIQPRSALGFSLKALLKILGEQNALEELSMYAHILNPVTMEHEGEVIAAHIGDRIPLLYASAKNAALAYNWKIKCNETGKIPAFYNVFPELNHNEMTGFNVVSGLQQLLRHFYFIFLKDVGDHPRNQKRMEITAKLYQDRGMDGEIILLKGNSFLEKAFNSLILADWTAYYIAKKHHADPKQVPMVEEFKKLIA